MCIRDSLKADSASVMMLVMDIESEFEIEVEDDAIEKVKTVADMVKYLSLIHICASTASRPAGSPAK